VDKKRAKAKGNFKKNGQDKSQKRFEFKCFKRHQKGHKAIDCKKKSDDNQSEDVSLLSTSDHQSDDCLAVSNDTEGTWCLDSECTSHLCKDVKAFSWLRDDPGSLRLASNASTNIKAKGVAAIVTTVEGKRSDVTLNDTRLVPDLRTNLLSVSRITDKGYSVVFTKENAVVAESMKYDSMKLTAKRFNLYYVKEAMSESCQNVEYANKGDGDSAVSLNEIWHRRMGHLNFRELHQASKNGIIRGAYTGSDGSEPSCEICLQGKMTRPSFPKASNRKSQKLALIHTDICGPMRVQSNGGSKYFITFTDDCTR